MSKKAAKPKPYTGPVVPRAVVSESGDNYARKDEKTGQFYFKLSCGHRSIVTKTREGSRYRFGPTEILPVPQRADYRPCDECRLALEAAGKPIPPCGLCRGKGEIKRESVTLSSSGGGSYRMSISRCPACHGRTTKPEEKKS